VTDATRAKPPYYHFAFLNMIDCNNWYQLNFVQLELVSGKIAGHTAPCDEDSMLTIDQAKAALAQHLSENGFDISMLP